ncbi:hypothetical protein GCM10023317_22100 [Actinopolymorpha pittospori]
MQDRELGIHRERPDANPGRSHESGKRVVACLVHHLSAELHDLAVGHAYGVDPTTDAITRLENDDPPSSGGQLLRAREPRDSRSDDHDVRGLHVDHASKGIR